VRQESSFVVFFMDSLSMYVRNADVSLILWNVAGMSFDQVLVKQ